MYRSFPHLLTILALLVVCGESTAQNTASSDADLSGLTLSAEALALSPTFASATLSYTVERLDPWQRTLANSVSSLTVTPTSNHNGATITVNGTSVSSGTASSAISLNVGENTITIVVTAEDGTTTKTYTVTVTRGVNIPDANLRNAIGEALQRHSRRRGDPISPREMATVTYVDLEGNDVSTFVGLEYATNLDSLNLADASISDISAFPSLTNLGGLNLSGNSISDISSLSGLTNLHTLMLTRNSISDISSLSGLTNLSWLSLYGNSISDISSLSGLTNLSRLSLSYNSISDISALSGLTNLSWLGLHGNSISDISSLSGLTNLSSLGLSGNSISDISSLSGLTNLIYLFLSNNSISDISALLGLTNLAQLGLEENRLSYLSLTTYISVFHDRGVHLSYHGRTLSRLVKISGDGQTGTAGSRLSDPFIVEAQAELKRAFAGVPVVFSIMTGGGVLSTTTDTTDTNGRASTTLTLGVAGANTVLAAVDVSGIDKSVTFTATATGGTDTPTNSGDAEDLSGLTLSDGILSPTFARDSLSYTATVANRVTSLTVTPKSNHNGAAITVNGTSVASGTASSAISLNVGENTIAIVVTAEDGTTKKTYTVTVTRGVNIPATELRAGIERQLKKSNGAIITPSEMATLTSLVLERGDIRILTGLEYATNLDTLILPYNHIWDISSLSGLTNLRYLNLRGNYIGDSDISLLSGLTNLHRLELGNNSILDISVLSGLTNLHRLSLARNRISDISVLSGLTNLSWLSLYGNNLSDISSLSGLTNLNFLDLADNHISDISVLLDLTNLSDLSLHANPLSYPSLTTHIPAFQARGATVIYSTRTLTRLVRISGGAQTGTAGSRLSDPFIVEVRDHNDRAFAGVPVAFSITAGGGVLSTTTDTTDSNGRASTTLTLGVAGANTVVAAIDVAGIDKSATFTATATGGTTEPGQVAGVAVTPGVGYLGVSWETVSEATGYKVQWKSGDELYASDRQQVIGNGGKTSSAITGLAAGTEYTVRVIAILANADDGPPSVDVTGTPVATTQPQPPQPPQPPPSADLQPSFDDSIEVAAQRYQQGAAIAPLTLPTATGGDGALTYGLTPDLPSGLTFDATTRVLSGTPLEVMAETTYTLTATDEDGDAAMLTFTLAVAVAEVVTEPGQVTGVAVAPGVGYLGVSWDVVSGATGYKVQWKSGDELYTSDRQQVIGSGGKTSSAITGLTAGTEYTVRVIAILTNADDGPPSVDVMGTPVATTQPQPPSADLQPSFGDSTVTAQRYRTGTAISIPLPRATGGDGALTYRLTPDLPSGLTFDATTRVLSGTPLEVMAETTYTLTATDEDGDAAMLTFALSVASDSHPTFGDSTVTAQRYVIGASVSLTLPEATGGDGSLAYILLPFLPNGLRFDPATRTLSGTPSKALTATEYTFSALDADGDVAMLTFTLEVYRPTADVDGNGRVNFDDFLSFVGKFGTRRGDAGYDARYDLDSDGAIGFSDFLIFAARFGATG